MVCRVGHSQLIVWLINMKTLLLFLAVAYAAPEAKPEAEADPFYYSTYGVSPYYSAVRPYYSGVYNYGVSPFHYSPLGKRSADSEPKADSDPWLYTYGAYGAASPYYGGVYNYGVHGVHNPYYYHQLGKRSAEAEPKADPWVYSTLGAYGVRPSYYGSYSYGVPYTYGTYGAYSAYHHLGKRSAEAESKPEADPALLYSAYSASPYVRTVSPVVSSYYSSPVHYSYPTVAAGLPYSYAWY